jgi:hypothetical protein
MSLSSHEENMTERSFRQKTSDSDLSSRALAIFKLVMAQNNVGDDARECNLQNEEMMRMIS